MEFARFTRSQYYLGNPLGRLVIKERKLIFIGLSSLKSLANPASSAKERAELLNSNAEATAFNQSRIEAAAKESDIVANVRAIGTDIKEKVIALMNLPKTVAKKGLETATKMVTTTAAVPANIARWGLDLVRAVTRLPLATTDYIAEQVGKISALQETIKGKVLATLDHWDEKLTIGGGAHAGASA